MSDAPSVEARDLVLARAGTRVLDGLSLRVAPGEFVALVGPSGCGKSTLLAVLAGLLEPDAGSVLIDSAPGERLGRLTLMPQDDALMPWRTVLENVQVAPRLAGASPADARTTSRRALLRAGLGGFEHHYPHALSGGMRQRVALARTLLGSARAWLLDEPFGALDALTRADLRTALADVWAERRPTTLLVTHDLDEAVLLADRILVCGPRPARVVGEIRVDLPRPRGLDDTVRPEYTALRAELLAALRGAGVLA
jgi:ABC-type nitrate/sulfonate/bicarbonate transport system ATPase subunit